jgi:FkbM family methyltransferase
MKPRSTLRRRLSRSAALRRAVEVADIVWKYRRLRPTELHLFGSDNVIHVDPADPRGRALLRSEARGQSSLKKTWQWAISTLRPAAVLDVGANYGEFLYLPEYEVGTRVVGVEANSRLIPFLEASRARHPNRDQIELVSAAAGSQVRSGTAFLLDKTWSGRSSVIRHDTLREVETIEVPMVTMDSLFDGGAPKTLVFKVDVEGYEGEVLRGMQGVLGQASEALGIIEFNPTLLTDAGESPQGFLEAVNTVGHLYTLGDTGELRRRTSADILAGPAVDDIVVIRGAALRPDDRR